jgi:hypothetical protein
MYNEAQGTPRASFASVPAGCELLIVCARPASAAGSFAALSAGDSRFFTREFVSRSLLVRRSTPFGCDRSLGLRIHGGESARRFPAYRSAAGSSFTDYAVSTAVVAVSSGTTRDSAASDSISIECSGGFASLIRKVASVVGLVCHFNLLPR